MKAEKTMSDQIPDQPNRQRLTDFEKNSLAII